MQSIVAKEFATNWTNCFLPSPQKSWHSSLPIFIFLLDLFSTTPPFHPFHYASPPFSPLSASFFEISLWFTATLPLLFFFPVSSPLAVYLVIFSCFSLPVLFFLSATLPFYFLFFSPSDFPPQRTLFSPPSFLARCGANPRFRRGNTEIEHRNEPIEGSRAGHCVWESVCNTDEIK